MKKPASVLYGELTLYAWVAWTCITGVMETKQQIPEIENTLQSDLQGLVSIPPDTLYEYAKIGYAGLAILSAWVIWEIGRGKHWARSTTLWSFVLQAGMMAFPPYKSIPEYIHDAPDLVLQIIALAFLYKASNKAFFVIPTASRPVRP